MKMDALNSVMVILSIGTIVGPIIFGWILVRMTAVFVTKQQFEDYKVLAQTERQFAHESLQRIENKLESQSN